MALIVDVKETILSYKNVSYITPYKYTKKSAKASAALQENISKSKFLLFNWQMILLSLSIYL